MVRGWVILTFLVAVTAISGCSNGQLPTMKIAGTLTVDGKPYGPATVSLSPVEGPSAKVPNATGQVSAEGRFQPASYGPNSGIVAGQYQATLGMDAMTFGSVPVTKPVTVSITSETKSLEISFETIKGKKSGYIPGPDFGAGTQLPPLK